MRRRSTALAGAAVATSIRRHGGDIGFCDFARGNADTDRRCASNQAQHLIERKRMMQLRNGYLAGLAASPTPGHDVVDPKANGLP